MHHRTPKNFDGTSVPGKRLSDLLPDVLKRVSHSVQDLSSEVIAEWNRLLGEEMASLTEPVFQNGVLTVKVKSATLYSLLCQYEKPRLFKALQKKFPIQGLNIRVG